ncbi:uncharacterized protein LOC113212522 [Frankliniella occidentalis]|uniref:Uncharacterized protein LOC113212522 n=1 Tax=Frankliniella occidentalis TaxID=133901 RepID=A0A9C6XAT2_FRAOC|nr:uncharacterized protein LOC113212522 [Frankliniella occidentalis]
MYRGPAGGEDSAPVAEQLQLAVQLEDSLRLLSAKKCSVVAEEEDGATWRACAELGGFGDILRLLLLPLRADDQLEKVDVAACSDQRGVYVGPPIISVLQTTEKDFKDGRLMINDILQDRKRWKHTRSLKIFHGTAGLEGLLSVVAPHLEELQIKDEVQPNVMVEVAKMKSLKRLDVKCVKDLDFPDLPLQLEELGIWYPTENQLRCLERMPRLRSLRVYNAFCADMNFAPSQHRALLWLKVGVNAKHFKNSILSLIQAYASSLQVLHILCSVSKNYLDSACYFPDLGEELGTCGLRALRRLVLVRPPNDPCTEQLAGCLLQCRIIGNSLPPPVHVVCSNYCNVPAS